VKPERDITPTPERRDAPAGCAMVVAVLLVFWLIVLHLARTHWPF
jgi:hypothetical protein